MSDNSPVPCIKWDIFTNCILSPLIFVFCLFLLVSGKGCCLWLWHSMNFSLTFFYMCAFSGKMGLRVHIPMHSYQNFLCSVNAINCKGFDQILKAECISMHKTNVCIFIFLTVTLTVYSTFLCFLLVPTWFKTITLQSHAKALRQDIEKNNPSPIWHIAVRMTSWHFFSHILCINFNCV